MSRERSRAIGLLATRARRGTRTGANCSILAQATDLRTNRSSRQAAYLYHSRQNGFSSHHWRARSTAYLKTLPLTARCTVTTTTEIIRTKIMRRESNAVKYWYNSRAIPNSRWNTKRANVRAENGHLKIRPHIYDKCALRSRPELVDGKRATRPSCVP